MTEETRAVAVQQSSPAELLKLAVEGNADIEKLEKLMDLQERWQASEARKAFNAAMSGFQADAPDLQKTGLVDFKTSAGRTTYTHVKLPHIAKAIAETLRANGLSYRYTISDNEKGLSVDCIVSHISGHSEHTSMSAPTDASGSKNAIQSRGSTVTYLQRYTLLAALGLVTADDDNDGRGNTEVVTKEQADMLEAGVKESGTDLTSLLGWGGCESLATFPADKFEQAMAGFEKRKAKLKAEKAAKKVKKTTDAEGELGI